MGTLKKVIIYVSGALSLICIVGIIANIVLFDKDAPPVFAIPFVPMVLIFSFSFAEWHGYDDYEYYYPYSNTEPELNQENKTIVITETRCPACGAPLEDEVCGYCGTRVVIYKTIT